MVTTGKAGSSPGDTIEITKGSPSISGTVTSTDTLYAGLLTEPDIGSIGNGVKALTANFGDSNTVEGDVYQIEVPPVHPQSNAPNNITTAFSTNDSVVLKKHVIGKSYWLKGSSVTAVKGAKLIPAGSGLVKAMLAHTATPLPIHTWVCDKAVSSATWIQATYKGIVSSFTAA